MSRFVNYSIGLTFILNVIVLANKLPLDSDEIKTQNYNNRWTFENGAEKIERREGLTQPTVTIPNAGPFNWKWTWNSKVNTTSTVTSSSGTTTTTSSTQTTTTASPTTNTPPVYVLKRAARKSLRNALRGCTPEKRKKQLAQMGKKMKIEKISKSQSKILHKSYRKVNVTKNPPALDMFEINERAGLNDYLFQGDINLDEKQISEFASNAKNSRKKRQVQNSAQFWSDKVVYYYFDSGLGTAMQQIVIDAMTLLQETTCVKFVMNSTAPNRVKIINGVGCYSNVGMLGGEQTLSLGSGCEIVGTAAHELSHTLGVFHTQMRSDRDEYVTIDLTDVPSGSQSNFYKMTAAESTNYVDYEYGSFMHYTARAFTTGAESIVPKEPVMVYTMGGRIVTFLDLKMLNTHYSCSCPTPLNCGNGGYTNPANCSVCNCPYGFGGTLCTERADYGCGSELAATDTWQQETYTFGVPTNVGVPRSNFLFCVHWVKAPVGKQIQWRMDSEDANNKQCIYGCIFNGLEPKLKNDMTMTQTRYCCQEYYGEIMTAETNPMPVFSYNRYNINKYTWSYRYVDEKANKCLDQLDITTCLALKTAYDQGCSIYDTSQLKVMCAVTMNLCGKIVSGSGTCEDRFEKAQCNNYSTNGLCSSQISLVAEFSCAFTCGFCVNPV